MSANTIARLLVILFFAVLIASIIIIAKADADIELTTTLNTYNDQYLSASNGFKLNWIAQSGFYLSGEYSGYSELRYGGQDTAEVFFYSLSAGLRAHIDLSKAKGFVYVQAGYYQPYFNYMSSYQEAFGYRHHELLHGTHYRHWQKYNYELHPGIGGEFGLGITKPISESITLSMFGAKRILKLREVIRGWGPAPKEDGYWKTRNDKDFGGLIIGLNITKEF